MSDILTQDEIDALLHGSDEDELPKDRIYSKEIGDKIDEIQEAISAGGTSEPPKNALPDRGAASQT